MATSKAKTKTKQQAADDEEDKPDQAKDETAEDEEGDMTDEQKREAAFRKMVAKKRGK